MAAPVISGITEIIPSTGLRTHELYELTFLVVGSYTNAFYPYSTLTIPGFTNGIGATVNIELTQDETVLTTPEAAVTKHTMPCFYAEDVVYSLRNTDHDHFLKMGTFQWHARVSFPTAGAWYRRLTALDSGGSSVSAWVLVKVSQGTNHGPVRLCPNDGRLLEFSDSSRFAGQGVQGYLWDNKSNPTANEPYYQDLRLYGLQVIRQYHSEKAFWAASAHPWRSIEAGANHDSMLTAATFGQFQLVSSASPATSGTYAITINGQTATIAYNATASQLRTALGALSSVGGAGNVATDCEFVASGLAASSLAQASAVMHIALTETIAPTAVISVSTAGLSGGGGASSITYWPGDSGWITPPAYTDGAIWGMETTPGPRASQPNRDLSFGWRPTDHACEPSTTYELEATYAMSQDLVSAGGGPFGLCWKTGGATANVTASGTGTLLSGYATNATAGTWQTLTGTYTSGAGQYFFPGLHLVLENCASPSNSQRTYNASLNRIVGIARIRIRKVISPGVYGPDLNPRPTPNMLDYVNERVAAQIDREIDLWGQYGIYARFQVHNGDYLSTHTSTATGKFVGLHDIGADNYYCPDDTSDAYKVRFQQRAVERYCQARWGWSPNILLWEGPNEGDAGETGDYRHFNQVDLMGGHFESYTLNPHLIGPSIGRGLFRWQMGGADRPRQWRFQVMPVESYRPDLSEVYTIQPGRPGFSGGFNHPSIASLTDTVLIHTEAVTGLRGSLTNCTAPIMKIEQGYWQGATTGPSSFARDPGGVWWHKNIWPQVDQQGVYENGYWYDSAQLFIAREETTLGVCQRYRLFVDRLPTNQGGYTDAAASASSGLLRMIGAKNATTGFAHLWIDNTTHTTGTVQAGTAPTAVTTAMVTITGLLVLTAYTASWFDTYTGQWFAVRSLRTDSVGTLRFWLPRPLSTDVAVTLEPASVTQPATVSSVGGGR